MNHSIIFFVSCVTFVLSFLVKIPIKKMTRKLAQNRTIDEEEMEKKRHRYNLSIIIMVCLISLICYFCVLRWLGEKHVKLCCAIKASALAMAYYAIYDQWVGRKGNEGEI